MSNQPQQTRGGIGFLGLLTTLFIALKLTGYIDWSWFWVLAPLWLPLAAVAVILIVAGLATLIIALLKRREQKKRAKDIRHPRIISDLDTRR